MNNTNFGSPHLQTDSPYTWSGTQTFQSIVITSEDHTASDTLTTAEAGTTHTNYGASGAITLTLPSATGSGISYLFAVGAAQELKVKIGAASQSIIVGGSTSTDDGGADLYISADDEGEYLELLDIAAGKWLATRINGTWTVTQP